MCHRSTGSSVLLSEPDGVAVFLFTTGGTALAIIQLLTRLGVNPSNIYYACVSDLKFLNGSEKIRETGVTMISLVDYDE